MKQSCLSVGAVAAMVGLGLGVSGAHADGTAPAANTPPPMPMARPVMDQQAMQAKMYQRRVSQMEQVLGKTFTDDQRAQLTSAYQEHDDALAAANKKLQDTITQVTGLSTRDYMEKQRDWFMNQRKAMAVPPPGGAPGAAAPGAMAPGAPAPGAMAPGAMAPAGAPAPATTAPAH